MAELIEPFVGGEVGRQDKAPAVASDLDNRDEFRRENLPLFLESMTVEEIVPAPGPSAQAVLDAGVAETYDLSALADLELVVDDYLGRKNAPGVDGYSISGSNPGTTTAAGSSDQARISLHGEALQAVIIGAQADGPSIAAQIQTVVRGLTPANPENAEAYAGFVAEYVEHSFSTTLARAIPAGSVTRLLKLASLGFPSDGLRRGDVLEVVDQTGGPEPAFEVEVLDIRTITKEISVRPLNPSEDIEVGAIVRKPNSYFRFTSGKRGSDSSVVWSAGAANDMSAALKLTSAQGASEVQGADAIGVQRFSFVAGDFAAPGAATAAELAAVLNKSLTGAIAEDNGGTLRITSRKYGKSANVAALPGVTQAILQLSTDGEVGSQTDITVSLRDAEILQIQQIDGSNAPQAYLSSPGSLVRIEGDKLVNVDDTNHAATNPQWRLVLSPRRL